MTAPDIRKAAAAMGRKGGKAKTAAKAKAARDNGKRGGRPREIVWLNARPTDDRARALFHAEPKLRAIQFTEGWLAREDFV